MIQRLLLSFLLFAAYSARSQSPLGVFADSIRVSHHIPALCYAVVSSDSILDIRYLGVKQQNPIYPIGPADRFRIGSNTKAITAFIAAEMVKKGQISWQTKFFDLLPEMRAGADRHYRDMTLIDLLAFRVPFPSYTYTDAEPTYEEIDSKEKAEDARMKFVGWFLHRPPAKKHKGLYRSNVSYSAAGLMLERASGHSYPQLVDSLNAQLGIALGIGTPRAKDSTQTPGHNADGTPEASGDSYKLNWLLPAGNINATPGDYAKFIQLQLKGLQGRSEILSAKEFEYLHYSSSPFAVGWYCDSTATHHPASHNLGNPGTFTSEVYVIRDIDRAYIILTNIQSEEAYKAITVVMREMKKRYGE